MKGRGRGTYGEIERGYIYRRGKGACGVRVSVTAIPTDGGKYLVKIIVGVVRAGIVINIF